MLKKALITLLMLAASVAAAQTPNLAFFWCIDVTLDESLWDKPMYSMTSGTYVFMASRAFRLRLGPFATQTACETYRSSEVASNYASPDALHLVYTYIDLNGNPGAYTPSFAQLNPVPDATCTSHYLVPPGT